MTYNSTQRPNRATSAPITSEVQEGQGRKSPSTTTMKTIRVYNDKKAETTISSWDLWKTKCFSVFSSNPKLYENYNAENWQELVDNSCCFSLLWNHIEGKIDAQIEEMTSIQGGVKEQESTYFLAGFSRFLQGLYDSESLKDALRVKIGTLRKLESDMAETSFTEVLKRSYSPTNLIKNQKKTPDTKSLNEEQRNLLRSLKIQDTVIFKNVATKFSLDDQTNRNNFFDSLLELELPSSEEATPCKRENSSIQENTSTTVTSNRLSTGVSNKDFAKKITDAVENMIKLYGDFSKEDVNLLLYMFSIAFLLGIYPTEETRSFSIIDHLLENQISEDTLEEFNQKIKTAIHKKTVAELDRLSNIEAHPILCSAATNPNLHKKLKNTLLFLHALNQILLEKKDSNKKIIFESFVFSLKNFYDLGIKKQKALLNKLSQLTEQEKSLIINHFQKQENRYSAISFDPILLQDTSSETIISQIVSTYEDLEQENDLPRLDTENLIPGALFLFIFRDFLTKNIDRFTDADYPYIEAVGDQTKKTPSEQIPNGTNTTTESIVNTLVEIAAWVFSPLLYTGTDDYLDSETQDSHEMADVETKQPWAVTHLFSNMMSYWTRD